MFARLGRKLTETRCWPRARRGATRRELATSARADAAEGRGMGDWGREKKGRSGAAMESMNSRKKDTGGGTSGREGARLDGERAA